MNAPKKKPEELRSQQWFGRQDRDGFAYRSWVKGKGVPHDQFDGRPVIGICNTFSELTPCNSHFRTTCRAGEDWRLRSRWVSA
jgi:L-arabonate dehydrase